jgi:ankyrin repeat protein
MFQVRSLGGHVILRSQVDDFERVAHVKLRLQTLRRSQGACETVLLRLVLPDTTVLSDQTSMVDLPPEIDLQLVACKSDPALGPELLKSVERGNWVEVDQQLKNRADPNYRTASGHTPLIAACLQGRLDIVELLCAAGADIGQSTGLEDEDLNPIFAAADVGSVEVVRHLQQMGADMHKPVGNGATPLHAAAFRGHLDVVRLLSTPPSDGKNTVRPSVFGAMSVALRAGKISAAVELLRQFHWIVLWPWLDTEGCTDTSFQSSERW